MPTRYFDTQSCKIKMADSFVWTVLHEGLGGSCLPSLIFFGILGESVKLGKNAVLGLSKPELVRNARFYIELVSVTYDLINCKCCIKHDPTLPCQYIGQTSRTLRERFGEHRRGIKNNTDESVPIHFNQPKQTLNDVQLISMLHFNNNRDSIRRSVEQHLIERAELLKTTLTTINDSYLIVSYSKLCYNRFFPYLFIHFSLFSKHPIARASSQEL